MLRQIAHWCVIVACLQPPVNVCQRAWSVCWTGIVPLLLRGVDIVDPHHIAWRVHAEVTHARRYRAYVEEETNSTAAKAV